MGQSRRRMWFMVVPPSTQRPTFCPPARTHHWWQPTAANPAFICPQARALLPGLPQLDDRVLDMAKMGLFQNILLGGGFGGLASDMIEVRRATVSGLGWLARRPRMACLMRLLGAAGAPAAADVPALPTLSGLLCIAVSPSSALLTALLTSSWHSPRVQMAMISSSMRDVKLMAAQVQAACAWAQSNTAAYQQQDATLKAQVRGEVGMCICVFQQASRWV